MVGLLQLIEAERSGEAIDRVLMAHLLRCFTSLGIYTTAFQTPFLQQTNEFYASEGLRCMATYEVAEYLVHCEVRDLAAYVGILPRDCALCSLSVRMREKLVCDVRMLTSLDLLFAHERSF